MSGPTEALFAKLEPEAIQAHLSPEQSAAFSIAISLKRIADVFDSPSRPDLAWLAEQAGQAFSLGMRGRG